MAKKAPAKKKNKSARAKAKRLTKKTRMTKAKTKK
jgi:hypothetical protein